MNRKIPGNFIVKNSRRLATHRFYSSTKQWNDFEKFRPVIGLELHAQLATKTKLFSPSAAFDMPTTDSNSHVSPFDSAIPGTLPSLSRSCVEKSILAAFLLNCEVADFCRFDRKHYFYPDLPLGYQITQKAQPIAKNGYLGFFAQFDPSFPSTSQQTGIYEKRVRIQQIQLEIDSGKTIRDDVGDLLDLNRAGLALIEIVTAPEFDNPMEVGCFVEHLRILLTKNGICAGHGHEGNLRVDANISISQSEDDLGTRTELKNLSNVGHLVTAIDKELKRQIRILEKGGVVEQETRAVDAQGQSISARAKGAKLDYRFLPEPNLPPMAIEPMWLNAAKNNAQFDLPHLGFIRKFGFSPIFAFEIVNDKKLGDFIRAYLAHGLPIPFAQLSEWLKELEYFCQKLPIHYPPTNESLIRNFAKLIHLEWSGRLTKLVAIDLLREMTNGDQKDYRELEDIIEAQKLWRIDDPKWIDELVESAIEEQPTDFLERLLQGKNKPMAKLKRMAIEKSRRRASPADVEAAIGRKIEQQFSKMKGRHQ